MNALVRWLGHTTSGRYVYRSPSGEWWWQCDLCGAPDEGGDPGPYVSQPQAFAAALDHVQWCRSAV